MTLFSKVVQANKQAKAQLEKAGKRKKKGRRRVPSPPSSSEDVGDTLHRIFQEHMRR